MPKGSQSANSLPEMSDQLVSMLADHEALKQIGETNSAHFDANFFGLKPSLNKPVFTKIYLLRCFNNFIRSAHEKKIATLFDAYFVCINEF